VPLEHRLQGRGLLDREQNPSPRTAHGNLRLHRVRMERLRLDLLRAEGDQGLGLCIQLDPDRVGVSHPEVGALGLLHGRIRSPQVLNRTHLRIQPYSRQQLDQLQTDRNRPVLESDSLGSNQHREQLQRVVEEKQSHRYGSAEGRRVEPFKLSHSVILWDEG